MLTDEPRVQWTRELPVRPGWYWHRGEILRHTPVIQVGDWGPVGVLTAFDGQGYWRLEQLGGEWAGPLTPPARVTGEDGE